MNIATYVVLMIMVWFMSTIGGICAKNGESGGFTICIIFVVLMSTCAYFIR